MELPTTPVVRCLLVAMVAISRMAPADDAPTPGDPEGNAAPHVAVEETTPVVDVAVGFTSTFGSRYVFRGQAYSAGPVSQSTAWVEIGRFTFYAWNNVLLAGEPLQRRLNEVDVGVAYAYELGAVTLTPALDHYTYRTVHPLEDPPTVEASLQARWTLGSVDVFTQPIVDLASARGALFLRSGIAHELLLGERTTLSTEATIGWASARYNDFYVGVAKGAFHHAGVEVALGRRVSQTLSVTCQLGLTHILDGGLRRALEAPDVPRLGVTIGVDLN